MPDPSSNESPNLLLVTGVLDSAAALSELHFPDGKIVRLPTALLQQDNTSSFAADTAVLREEDLAAAAGTPLVIPLVEEQLEVSRRTVKTGTVHLRKTIHEFETQLDEPLAVRTFDVERVILNQPVDSAPAVRQEGDTTVYPLVEEQLILTKQLVLKEELRVTRHDTERRDTRAVTLRREHIAVERNSA